MDGSDIDDWDSLLNDIDLDEDSDMELDDVEGSTCVDMLACSRGSIVAR